MKNSKVNILTVDCRYIYPELAACFILIRNGRAIIIETNTEKARPYLLDTLRQYDILPENVDYVLLTHIHLDHSAGTANLLRILPAAKVLVHPRGLPHLLRPERLVRSARAVYGEEHFQQLYGEVAPVPAARASAAADNQIIPWQGLNLQLLFTEGHASHHMSIWLHEQGCVFTGDAFGVAYPMFRNYANFLIFPATVPPEFHVNEARQGIQRILLTGAETVYLTHYGALPAREAGKKLLQHLDFFDSAEFIHFAEAMAQIEEEEIRYQKSCALLEAYYQNELNKLGIPVSEEGWQRLLLDIHINAQGIAYSLKKGRIYD